MNIYRRLLIFAGVLFTLSIHAQVAIGKSMVDGSGLLDVESGGGLGIILPIVETLPVTPANGTLLMDKNDATIKMYENNQWINYSSVGSVSQVQLNPNEDTGQGVVIGAETSTVSGVLVLESIDKALILPKIAIPHLTVKNPYPGMMCYDTTSKSVAIFDGSVWNYLKKNS